MIFLLWLFCGFIALCGFCRLTLGSWSPSRYCKADTGSVVTIAFFVAGGFITFAFVMIALFIRFGGRAPESKDGTGPR